MHFKRTRMFKIYTTTDFYFLELSYVHQGRDVFIWAKKSNKNDNIVKYYYNLKMTFLFQSILKHNLFFWNKAEFSAAITPVFSVKHLLLLSVLKKKLLCCWIFLWKLTFYILKHYACLFCLC